MARAASPAAAAMPARYFSSAKFRRSVSPLGEPPRAAEIRSHDQSAARASRTATRSAFCAVRRASAAFFVSSSTVVAMPKNAALYMPQIKQHAAGAGAWALTRQMKTKPVEPPGREPVTEDNRFGGVPPASACGLGGGRLRAGLQPPGRAVRTADPWNHPYPCCVKRSSERRLDFFSLPLGPAGARFCARRGLPGDLVTGPGRGGHGPVPAQCNRLSVLVASST
jgi:hypothetical protein